MTKLTKLNLTEIREMLVRNRGRGAAEGVTGASLKSSNADSAVYNIIRNGSIQSVTVQAVEVRGQTHLIIL